MLAYINQACADRAPCCPIQRGHGVSIVQVYRRMLSLVQDYANRDPGCQRLRGHGVRIVPVYRKGVTLSQDTDPGCQRLHVYNFIVR